MLIVELSQGGLIALQGLPEHEFSSGSKGYFTSFKVDGVNAEVSVGVTIKNANGAPVAIVTALPKEFKTGSKGYFTTSKATIGDGNYQVQAQLVNIGSKLGAGRPGAYQVQVQLVRIGSKTADDAVKAAADAVAQQKAKIAEDKARLAEAKAISDAARAARKAEKEQRREAARHAAAEQHKAENVAALSA